MRGAAGNRFWSERGTRYCAVWPRNAKFLWSKEFSRSPLPPPVSLPRSIRFIPIEPDGTEPPWAVQECLVRRFLELPRSYRFQPTPGTGMQMDERGTGINAATWQRTNLRARTNSYRLWSVSQDRSMKNLWKIGHISPSFAYAYVSK